MDTKPLAVLMSVMLVIASIVLAAVIIVINDSAMYSDVQQIQQQEECMDVDDRVVLPNE